jgi:hypothetical protein
MQQLMLVLMQLATSKAITCLHCSWLACSSCSSRSNVLSHVKPEPFADASHLPVLFSNRSTSRNRWHRAVAHVLSNTAPDPWASRGLHKLPMEVVTRHRCVHHGLIANVEVTQHAASFQRDMVWLATACTSCPWRGHTPQVCGHSAMHNSQNGTIGCMRFCQCDNMWLAMTCTSCPWRWSCATGMCDETPHVTETGTQHNWV